MNLCAEYRKAHASELTNVIVFDSVGLDEENSGPTQVSGLNNL